MRIERKGIARTLVRVLAPAILLASMACAVKAPPPPQTPATATVPDDWVVENRTAAAATTGATDWIASFGDAQLENLVTEALENNLNLRIAAAGLQIAEQFARKAGAPLYPWVSVGASGAGLGGFEADTATNQSGISLDVFWELDVWGRIRAGKAAAGADYRAATADYDFAQLSLAGQAAKAWFQTVEIKLQVQLSEDAVELYRRNLQLARVRYDAGLVTELDIHLAESQLAAEEETLRRWRSGYEEGVRALEILLGRYPATELEIVDDLAAVPPPVAAGIPSEVLERRPDLVSAELRLASAFHSIQVAEAARLPRIALTGSVGSASSDLRETLNAPNPFWTLAAGLLAPVFQAGDLQANVEIANAEQEAAVAQYGQAALRAFGEVETTLAKEDDMTQARASVTTAEASLVSAGQQVTSLDASLDAATAAVAQTEAQVVLARDEYNRFQAAQEQDPGAVSETIVDAKRQSYLALEQAFQQALAQQARAQAAVDSVVDGENTLVAQAGAQLRQARASESKARLALDSVINGENTSVAQIRAQLRQAQLNLDWTTITAPADGFVTNLQLREGYIVRAGTPVMSFVDASEQYLIVPLAQNVVRHVEPGNGVEVALKLYPGKIFNGSVESVAWASGEGQENPSGSLPSVASLEPGTELAVRVVLTDFPTESELPIGAGGAAAIFSEGGKPLRIIRKVVIRMYTWLNYF